MSMSRVRNYDIIRVIAIVMVICIHCMMPLRDSLIEGANSISNWVCALYYAIISAGVPMFFMLSGTLLLGKDEPCLTFYKKRFSRLLIPFIIWSIIVYTLSALFLPAQGCVFYVKDFLHLLLTKGVNAAYWFVYMLLVFYLLTPICRIVISRIHNYKLCLIGIVMLYLVGFYLTLFVPSLKAPCRWLCYFCFYVGGYFCQKISFPNVKRWWIGIIVLILIVNTICSVYQISYIPWTLIYSYLLFICINQVSLPSSKDDAITMFSRNSYGIYLSHVIFCGILMRVSFYVQHVPLVILPILTTAIVVGIEYVMMRVIEKMGWNRYLC